MTGHDSTGSQTDVEKDVEIAHAKDGGVNENTTPSQPEYPPLSKVIVILLALYLAVFLVALDQTIIGVAIPKITDQFKSIEDIAWYGSAYFLTSTALQPSFGRIYKIFSVSFILYRLEAPRVVDIFLSR